MDKNSGEERFYIDDKLSYDDEPAAAVVGNVVRAAGTTRHLNADRAVENVTVKVGQQAVLPCFVNNLGSFKVKFLSYFCFFFHSIFTPPP